METTTKRVSPRKPKEIAEVERRLRANGKKAGLPARLACYSFYDQEADEWTVGAGYEDGMGCSVLRGGEWFYRDPHTGEDRPSSYEAALSGAEIWFTG